MIMKGNIEASINDNEGKKSGVPIDDVLLRNWTIEYLREVPLVSK